MNEASGFTLIPTPGGCGFVALIEETRAGRRTLSGRVVALFTHIGAGGTPKIVAVDQDGGFVPVGVNLSSGGHGITGCLGASVADATERALYVHKQALIARAGNDIEPSACRLLRA